MLNSLSLATITQMQFGNNLPVQTYRHFGSFLSRNLVFKHWNYKVHDNINSVYKTLSFINNLS